MYYSILHFCSGYSSFFHFFHDILQRQFHSNLRFLDTEDQNKDNPACPRWGSQIVLPRSADDTQPEYDGPLSLNYEEVKNYEVEPGLCQTFAVVPWASFYLVVRNLHPFPRVTHCLVTSYVTIINWKNIRIPILRTFFP